MARPSAIAERGASLLDRIALGTALSVPLFLMHGHGIAEALIAIVAACFLLRSATLGEWGWLRQGWVPLAIAWWAWVLIVTIAMNARSVGQALLVIRFPVFVAALEHFVLRGALARRWLRGVIVACTAWITLNVLWQFATGWNLFGAHRGPAGELTGPFRKPRAGPPLSRLLLPVLIPPAAALLARRRLWSTAGAYAILLGATCVVVLINQRMPLLLFVFGLVVAALLLDRLRPVVVSAAAAGVVLIAASVAISPYTHQRLVVQFSHQMEHFGSSPYGLLYARAGEIARQHPLTGLGFDAFRYSCPQERYFRPSFDGVEPRGGGAQICAQHPHNPYLEALDNGGIPGLMLFVALVLAWMAPLTRELWPHPAPLRVGLFAAVLIQVWPIASTSAFTSLPMGAWFFLTLGWALAESRHRQRPTSASDSHRPD
ncbi:MAG: O-antigen ligase family protein [Acetobacteraceae bacterium]|nr:O-antigen ligase family protein [Acetobacteraceae bacterium]